MLGMVFLNCKYLFCMISNKESACQEDWSLKEPCMIFEMWLTFYVSNSNKVCCYDALRTFKRQIITEAKIFLSMCSCLQRTRSYSTFKN